MTEWWNPHAGELVAGIGGSVVGVICGLYGTAVGILAPKGKGAGIMIPIHLTIALLGFVALAAGIVAAVMKQPYHVYHPLLLMGGISCMVMGAIFPAVLGRYRNAEKRKMEAESLRRS